MLCPAEGDAPCADEEPLAWLLLLCMVPLQNNKTKQIQTKYTPSSLTKIPPKEGDGVGRGTMLFYFKACVLNPSVVLGSVIKNYLNYPHTIDVILLSQLQKHTLNA